MVAGDGAVGDGGGGDESYGCGGDEGLVREGEWVSGGKGEGGRAGWGGGRGLLTANMGRMIMGSTVGIEALGSPWGC